MEVNKKPTTWVRAYAPHSQFPARTGKSTPYDGFSISYRIFTMPGNAKFRLLLIFNCIYMIQLKAVSDHTLSQITCFAKSLHDHVIDW